MSTWFYNPCLWFVVVFAWARVSCTGCWHCEYAYSSSFSFTLFSFSSFNLRQHSVSCSWFISYWGLTHNIPCMTMFYKLRKKKYNQSNNNVNISEYCIKKIPKIDFVNKANEMQSYSSVLFLYFKRKCHIKCERAHRNETKFLWRIIDRFSFMAEKEILFASHITKLRILQKASEYCNTAQKFHVPRTIS